MKAQLEHANVSVGNIDEAIRFLNTALPEYRIRHRGGRKGKDEWVHIGTEDSYIALNEARPGGDPDEEEAEVEAYRGIAVNHIGFVVEDAKALRARLLKAGYREGFVPDPHPHRMRVYFHDGDGTEWEFVEYFSEDPRERNDYN